MGLCPSPPWPAHPCSWARAGTARGGLGATWPGQQGEPELGPGPGSEAASRVTSPPSLLSRSPSTKAKSPGASVPRPAASNQLDRAHSAPGLGPMTKDKGSSSLPFPGSWSHCRCFRMARVRCFCPLSQPSVSTVGDGSCAPSSPGLLSFPLFTSRSDSCQIPLRIRAPSAEKGPSHSQEQPLAQQQAREGRSRDPPRHAS